MNKFTEAKIREHNDSLVRRELREADGKQFSVYRLELGTCLVDEFFSKKRVVNRIFEFALGEVRKDRKDFGRKAQESPKLRLKILKDGEYRTIRSEVPTWVEKQEQRAKGKARAKKRRQKQMALAVLGALDGAKSFDALTRK